MTMNTEYTNYMLIHEIYSADYNEELKDISDRIIIDSAFRSEDDMSKNHWMHLLIRCRKFIKYLPFV